MKKTKSFLSLMVAFALLLTLFSAPVNASSNDKHKDNDLPKSNIQTIVNDMQPGWNLGNTFDAIGSDETAWGNPRVTKEFIKKLAKQGFKSIRIPVTWDQRIGAAPDYKIDPAFLDRLQEVVDWALDERLYVMINMHHDSWMWMSKMGSDHDQVLARYEAVWTQVADRFRNYPDRLLFESINEPRFSDSWGTNSSEYPVLLDELLTSFHKIVRDSGGKNAERPLVLPTLETNAAQDKLDALAATIAKLNDKNLIATFHYYGFWPFSVNIAGFTRFDDTTKKDLTDSFDRVYDTLVSKGIPVILGEYGLLGFDVNTGTVEHGEMLKYFEFMTYYAKEKNITTMLWDNGQHFGRQTYQWADSELYNVLKAGWKGRSATAESDLLYVKKGSEIQDTAITLNLNENCLTAIKLEGKMLHRGRDYVLNDNVLTVKAGLLAKLTASGNMGEAAQLSLQFNKGADWSVHVLYYDTPVLQDAQGTTDAFAIPTSFNGDRLATMEAIYDDGSYAGPQGWTAYKEFGRAFSPSYESNQIKLPAAFFNETHDGKITLKFHFWSGAVVTYTLDKAGTSVTGTAS